MAELARSNRWLLYIGIAIMVIAAISLSAGIVLHHKYESEIQDRDEIIRAMDNSVRSTGALKPDVSVDSVRFTNCYIIIFDSVGAARAGLHVTKKKTVHMNVGKKLFITAFGDTIYYREGHQFEHKGREPYQIEKPEYKE